MPVSWLPLFSALCCQFISLSIQLNNLIFQYKHCLYRLMQCLIYLKRANISQIIAFVKIIWQGIWFMTKDSFYCRVFLNLESNFDIKDAFKRDAVPFPQWVCLNQQSKLFHMKMFNSFAFAVAMLCPIVFVFPTYSTNVFENESPNDTAVQCIIRNEEYWKLIPWFYSRLTFVDVYAISLPNAPEPINQLSSVFLHALTESKSSFMR